METSENTFGARSRPVLRLVGRLVIAGLIGLLLFAFLQSPIPLGARLLKGGWMKTSRGHEEYAIYELPGADALLRLRQSAERTGFVVIHSDIESLQLVRGSSRIIAQRGHALQSLVDQHDRLETDSSQDTAVIYVLGKAPAWRSALTLR
jgi:hypothetical protein